MSKEYTYAVARIRAKELGLLTKQDLDTLIQTKDYDEAIRFLFDKGYGEDEKVKNAEEIIKKENEKTWELMSELVDDLNELDIFTIPNDFHNLKVSIKAVTRDITPVNMFVNNGNIEPQVIYEAVKSRNMSSLPNYLSECGKEALTALLQTSDGQLCDIIVDRASLEELSRLGLNADNDIIRLYTELSVASTNIKIAVRCNKTEKSLEFISKCLANCSTLNVDMLAKAASKSLEDIYNYLSYTSYSGAVEALKKSPTEFEKWCDNLLMEKMKTQKWEPFTIGPLVAYVIARDTEIKAVRIILSAKLNNLDTEIVKERLRDMYV